MEASSHWMKSGRPLKVVLIITASRKHIPLAPPTPHKPWISEATFALIRKRQEARRANDWSLEKELRRETKQSSRRDRARWLQDLAGSGDWQSLRKLRGGNKARQTRLRDCRGCIVSSELRADTLADHLEKTQWGVRPVTLQPDPPPPVFPELSIEGVC